METARAAGVDPKAVNYVAYDGGGDLLTALLGQKITAGTSGLGEYVDRIEAGQVRVLAVPGKERVAGIDAPTLTEAGVDLTFTNWRGVLARPVFQTTPGQRWSKYSKSCTIHRNGRRPWCATVGATRSRSGRISNSF